MCTTMQIQGAKKIKSLISITLLTLQSLVYSFQILKFILQLIFPYGHVKLNQINQFYVKFGEKYKNIYSNDHE